MFKWILFGRLLRKSMILYKLEEYPSATSMVDQALSMNSEDFTANFIRLRLAVIQRDVESAELYINQCKKNNPKAAEILIAPWLEVLADIRQGKNFDNLRLTELNMGTQVDLERIQDDRGVILFYPILTFAVFYFVVSPVLKMILGPSLDNIRFNILDNLSAVLLLFFYNYKSSLHINVYIRLCQYIDNTIMLLRSPYYLFIVAIITFFSVKTTPIIMEFGSSASIFDKLDLLITIPVATQLLNCGLVFRPLRKYNKALAYITTAILFGLESGGAYLFSLIYSYTFDRYKTIAAPIYLNVVTQFVRLLIGVS